MKTYRALQFSAQRVEGLKYAKGDKMKRIKVQFTMEIPEDKFDKACFKTMVNKKTLTFELRDMAEVHGRTQVYNWVDDVVNNRS